MGNTTASVHIRWSGHLDLALKAISRSYNKLGYQRVKKAAVEGGKHVVLLARAGQGYVSVYDGTNAQLDNGELKELARVASKALGPAVFTSLYDSDRYEFIVFAGGRQVDLLMTDAESYEGPMKQLSNKSRSTKWSGLFGRTLGAGEIEQAAAVQTAFADEIVAGLSSLIGLGSGQPQMNYSDFADGEEAATAELYFKRKPKALDEAPSGEIRLGDYFDSDNCRMRSVYPASWPIPVGSKRLATWLILSQGAGFSGGTVTVRRTGPDTLRLPKAIVAGCKFHNGQIAGSLEPPPPNLTMEELEKLVEAKRFPLLPVEAPSAQAALLRGEIRQLVIPSMTPERTTQILLILQVHLEPQAAGEWTIDVTMQPGAQTEYRHELPPLRIAALEQTWLPVVSGLNLKTRYDKTNLDATHLNELNYKQSRIPLGRELDHPAVASSVSILEDEGQATLDAGRSWLEAWLGPLASRTEGEIAIHTEKHMSGAFYVGKTKKRLPVSGFLSDKLWPKFFEDSNNYQTVLLSFTPQGAERPIAGIGLQHGFKQRVENPKESWEKHLAPTLAVMRGRPFEGLATGGTWHVFKWVVNHEDCYKYLGTTARDMEHQLDSFAAERRPLQAWSSYATWIPEFDRADRYECTVYEEVSVLNWFRGILNDGGLNTDKMTAAWCGNVLRMVSPHMWLCRQLIDQVDRARLEQVAQVEEINGVYRVALRCGCALDELELALLPILPVESARISML